MIGHARYLTLWFRKGNVGGGMLVEDILLTTFLDNIGATA